MTHEASCPHCGQAQVGSRSFQYRCGERTGEKILKRIGGDEKLRAAWVKFLAALREESRLVPGDVGDFLEAAHKTVERNG